ncbi:MAG: porin [Rhodospirillales bacterium]|nr:porin [Rhodospirillales bacterium]
MKKLLIASTALVATSFVATGAQAADPIKLGLGGFMQQVVAFTNNDDPNATTDYGSFDQKGTSEVYFAGSTKLDNGLTVGVHMQLETSRSDAGGTIDWSNMYVSSDTMGKLTLGEVGQVFAEGVKAPITGAVMVGVADHFVEDFIAHPTAVKMIYGTAVDVNDSNSIRYDSPSFSGFSFGAGYTAETSDNEQGPNDTNTRDSMWSAKVAYSGDFDGVGVKASVGYMRRNDAEVPGTAEDDGKAWNAGLNISYAGFTVGGSYAKVSIDNNALANDAVSGGMGWYDGDVFDLGVSYKTGPYGISLTYLRSEVEGDTANNDDDEVTFISLGGSYDMGPGVQLVGSLIHGDYDDETTAVANNNDGWGLVAGVKVSF